jgi:phosphatidylglycerol---prolipoprotein diacylglyceryl transferase
MGFASAHVHLIFDLLAALCAGLMTWAVWVWRLSDLPRNPLRPGNEAYFAALSAGILIGSYALGTGNLWLTGVPGVGRSIEGALAGGILAVEVYKSRHGIKGSTGLIFVPTFATLVAVGRIGCALSGLEDHTYGLPTALPWSHDFGDGISRHPVAVYESLSMGAFLAVALVLLQRRNRLFLARGFHLMVGFYALQRFAWEFLKPYATLIGPFNVFHLTSVALLVYAAAMLRKAPM